MSSIEGHIKCLAFSLALGCSALCSAATVYKSVDDNGVVSFSDTPPENEAATEKLVIATPPVSSSPQEYRENLDQMRATTDRMATDRREREKHRAELREIRSKSDAAEQVTQPFFEDYYPIVIGSNYNNRHHSPPWRPGQPIHPIEPPSAPPDSHINLGSNSQLMRPIVSTRR